MNLPVSVFHLVVGELGLQTCAIEGVPIKDPWRSEVGFHTYRVISSGPKQCSLSHSFVSDTVVKHF